MGKGGIKSHICPHFATFSQTSFDTSLTTNLSSSQRGQALRIGASPIRPVCLAPQVLGAVPTRIGRKHGTLLTSDDIFSY
jgi:hypothetical protein